MDLTLARKWRSLGIPVMGMNLHQVDSNLKFASKVEDLEDSVLESVDEKDYNCLALYISGTPMMCLDVDNKENSIENFHNYLKENNTEISDFFYETTVNGGLHLYFLNEGYKKNLFNNNNKGVWFDILSQGRVFTSPTKVGKNQYMFGERSPLELRSIGQIPKMPAFIKELLEPTPSKTIKSVYL